MMLVYSLFTATLQYEWDGRGQVSVGMSGMEGAGISGYEWVGSHFKSAIFCSIIFICPFKLNAKMSGKS